jgi:hypothetical protein
VRVRISSCIFDFVSKIERCKTPIFVLEARHSLRPTKLSVLLLLSLRSARAHSPLVEGINLDALTGFLRFLQMDWKMQPFWWRGAKQEGPALLRRFSHLEIFTLVIRHSKIAHKEVDMEVVKEAREHTLAAVKIEKERHSEWRVPAIKFDWGKDFTDFSIHTIAESLKPENQDETRLLYSWAKE